MKKSAILLLMTAMVSHHAFAQTDNTQAAKPTVQMISNAHLDTQWNWDVQTTIREYIYKTMKRNFTLFEAFPEYIFNFEGAVKYAWMKEYYPEDYLRVKDYIKAGRWHVCGSTWDATDPNMPSPESFIRNILYGQQFYQREFGVTSVDIFLPDCFGFGQTLPTVAAHCGLLGFSTQKLQWRQKPFYGDRKNPFPIGLWEGIDGSRIMMCDDAHNYSKKYKFTDLTSNKELKEMVKDSGLGIAYRYYGTGDTGGSPTMESVRTVVAAAAKKDGPLNIVIAPADQIYRDYAPFEAHPELPVWKDELLMDVHATGCYTSQAAMKLYNRRNEQMGDAAERGLSAALWLNSPEGAPASWQYPYQTISEAWKRVIWHQFHDDLTGTSIPRAYEFSWNDELISLNQFETSITAAAQAVSDKMNTAACKGTPVVLYNALGTAVSDVVTIDVPDAAKAYVIYDSKGAKVASQMLQGGKMSFVAKVPSVGYAVYDLRAAGKASASVGKAASAVSGKAAEVTKVENSVYAVTLDKNGDFCSIVDKRTGRELVSADKPFRLALFTKNPSYTWPAWEILRSTMEAEPEAIPAASVKLTSDGPVTKVVSVVREFGKSRIEQQIVLHEGALAERIDVKCNVHWEETDALLKAEFPMAVSNPDAVYDLGIGAKARGNNTDTKYEVYAQQWADLTAQDGSYGVAVMNDSKYGWDKPADNNLRLTLLHTPSTTTNYSYQDHQDHGDHEFTYSIMGHSGDYRQGKVVEAAQLMNQGVKAWYAGKHKGALGREWLFASSDNEAVSIRCIKPAEDGNGFVVRVYETKGQGAQKASIRLGDGIVSAQKLDGCENVLGEAQVLDGALSCEVGPYGIATYRVVPAAAAVASAASKTAAASASADMPLNLDFNRRTASYNGFTGDVGFDMFGTSMAAELLPDTLAFAGTYFVLGDPKKENALRCDGQTLTLPSKNGGVLYLLCNSNTSDLLVNVNVAGKDCPVKVPYFGGFVGQWGHVGHTEAFFKGVPVAFVGTHTHSMSGEKDRIYEYSYLFCQSVKVPAGCSEVTLPKNAGVYVYAATLVQGRNDLTPAMNLSGVHTPLSQFSDCGDYRNLLSDATVVEFSGEQNASESVAMMLDENPATKWCDARSKGDKYVVFDLGVATALKDWMVVHAGSEAESCITVDFALEGRNDASEQWQTIDAVEKNTENITVRTLSESTPAYRYLRFRIKRGAKNGNTARIYELAVH